MSNLTDTDTASYLSDFKDNYLKPIEAAHNKYQTFKELPPKESAKADDIAKKYAFLSSFVACVEKTLEENFILKQK